MCSTCPIVMTFLRAYKEGYIAFLVKIGLTFRSTEHYFIYQGDNFKTFKLDDCSVLPLKPKHL